MKPSFAIIGCGKVGTALGKHLAGAGYRPIGFSSKNAASARYAAEIAHAPDRYFENTWDAAKDADIVFITTPDDAIQKTCSGISENSGFKVKSVVFHCSGALASTELETAKSCGAMIGSLHPLQSFAAVQTDSSSNPFDGIMIAVEGEHAAVTAAERISRDLGAHPFTIRTEGKLLYHAAAVVASNYLVTLMGSAIKLMGVSGVSESEAFEILNPLIQGTLQNIKNTGIPDALTGPIARGDVGIIEKHLQAMADLAPERVKYYIENGMETIKVALAKGTLSDEAAKRLQQMFNLNFS